MTTADRISMIASGYVAAGTEIDAQSCGQFLSDLARVLQSGRLPTEQELGALECVAGMLLGDAMRTIPARACAAQEVAKERARWEDCLNRIGAHNPMAGQPRTPQSIGFEDGWSAAYYAMHIEMCSRPHPLPI